MDGSDSVHISIEDNETNVPYIPISRLPRIVNNSSTSSSLHSMLNRVRQHAIGNNIRHSSEWRMNFSNLRTFISNGNFRYAPLPALPNPINETLPDNQEHIHRRVTNPPSTGGIRFSNNPWGPESFNPERVNIRESLLSNNNTENNRRNEADSIEQQTMETRQQSNRLPPASHQDILAPDIEVLQARLEEENSNNVFSEMFVRVLGNFVRYLPFLAILFAKFIFDHCLGILDVILLQCTFYIVNKSLRKQVSKYSERNFGILLRDFGLILAVATFRVLLSSSSPDPFGLIISPPSESMTIEISAMPSNDENFSTLNLLSKYIYSLNDRKSMDMKPGNAVTITKAISLGLLIYYVAVNDLFLKLLTILSKIFLTMLPNSILRRKQRAQMYAVIEYSSQFYRALVPVRQWIMFLFKSYSGLATIPGVIFSAFYIGAKGFEFASRGKVLHNCLTSFIRNMDYERKPTTDELEAAGTICPICHDNYNAPIILTCNHVFCDDCVNQWFKREQTCPMCRAKVSEDPQWQDGSTTFFYQLC